jgi:isocitrate lyase
VSVVICLWHCEEMKQSNSLFRSYGDKGMLVYVQNIQRKERAAEVELLTHQKWS